MMTKEEAIKWIRNQKALKTFKENQKKKHY